MASVRGGVVWIWAAALLVVALPASAQPSRAAVRIDGFDLEQVASLAPGTVLNFSVFASPGAAATVLVEGAPRLVELRESQPGLYEGAYTIGAGERLRPQARVVATVWRDGAVARATLEEALLLDAAPPDAGSTVAVPATSVPMTVPMPDPMSMPRPVPMRVPAPPPRTLAIAAAPALRETASPIGGGAAGAAECRTCARVESIRRVDDESGAVRAGRFAGGVFGSLFGEEIGQAHARHVTGLLSALGGTPPGSGSAPRGAYEATLRLPDGSRRTRRYDALPPFEIGDTVRLEGASGERLVSR
jgi:outer membrane lipoprotein SlyB